MLLNIGSILLVFVLTSYSIFHFNKAISRPSNLITALFSACATAAVGFLLMHITAYQVLLTGGLFLAFAVVCGYFIGDTTHKVKGLNQILSGFLGGAIGTVLGYMTFITATAFLVVDVLFIVFVYVVLQIFDKQQSSAQILTKKKSTNKISKQPSYKVPGALLAISVIFVTAMSATDIAAGVIGQPQTQEAILEVENDLQVATIHVTASGFNPKNTTIKANTMVKIIFNSDYEEGKDIFLVSNDLGLNLKLKSGENMILLNDPVVGEYQFSLEPGNFLGQLIID
jgi:hypothetical protein